MLNALKLICLFILATVFHWAFASLFVRWGLSVNIILVFVTAFCALLKEFRSRGVQDFRHYYF